MVDQKGRLSNPSEAGSTPVSSGFRFAPASSDGSSGPVFGSREYWIEAKGQLSNPESELNRRVRQLTQSFDRSRTALDVANNPRPKPRRAVRRLSDRELEQMAEEYRAGDSVPVLVERYGIHRTTVMIHLEKMGVPRRAQKRKLTDAQVKELKRLRRLGLSYAELGRRFGVSPETVRKELT